MQKFHIQNMTCGGCVRGVTRAIQSADPAAQVYADPANRRVDIVSEQPQAVLQAALTKAGYQAVGIDP
jgi:copper chaperone